MTDARHEPTGISFPKAGRTWVRAVLRKSGAPLTFTHAGDGSRGRELGLPFDGVPAAYRERPVLFLHRNPIDTAVSFFFQVTKKDFAAGTFKYYQRYPRLWLRGVLPPARHRRLRAAPDLRRREDLPVQPRLARPCGGPPRLPHRHLRGAARRSGPRLHRASSTGSAGPPTRSPRRWRPRASPP